MIHRITIKPICYFMISVAASARVTSYGNNIFDWSIIDITPIGSVGLCDNSMHMSAQKSDRG